MLSALDKISYGLFILSVKNGEKDNACIINTVVQSCLSPEKLTFSVNRSNFTNELLSKNPFFTVSVISEKADFEIFKHFGFVSGRDTDKFKDFTSVIKTTNGTLAINKGTNAYISGKVTDSLDLGSHTVFTADITETKILNEDNSVTYDFYHKHIKPQNKIENRNQTVWRCEICGYEYVGEELPSDFICPLCKHPASDFEICKK